MKNTVSLLMAAALVSSSVAHALPYSKRSLNLGDYGVSTGDIGGATVILDHESPTVYVGPSAQKEVEGVFSFINGVTSCDDLYRIRSTTYRYPEDSQLAKVIKSTTPYSPSFDASFGIYAKNARLLEEINQAKEKTKNYLLEHKEVYAEYNRTRTAKEAVETQLASVSAELSSAQAEFSTAINALALNSDMTAEEREKEKKRIKQHFDETTKSIYEEKAKLTKENVKVQKEYAKALGAWSPYKDQLDWLTNLANNLSSGYTNLQTLASASLERSQDLIQKLESKPIGTASVGFNILGDEVEKVRSAFSSRGVPYGVARLPIFDVKLNFGYTKAVQGMENGSQGFDYQLETVSLPADTQTLAGELVGKYAGFDANSGKPLNILFGDDPANFGGAGAFNALVNQGAYCGTPTVKRKVYSYKDDKGEVTGTVYMTEYNSPQGSVFSQSVAMKYKYYAKAEPISGSCTLKVDKMADYWREAGSVKYWNLKGSYSRAWDDTKLTYKNDMGLECIITERPVGTNPEESKLINAAMERAIYDDMFAMFVMQYGKEYKVTQGQPPATPSESHPLANLGTALITLCGVQSVYCTVTGLVLKTVDEIVGARHNGSTSSKVEAMGTIRRSFNKDSYLVSEGTSVVNMRVRASNQ